MASPPPSRRMRVFCALLGLILLCAPAAASSFARPLVPSAMQQEQHASAPEQEDAADAETDVVDVSVGYTADGFANVAGGIERGGAVLDNVDLTATIHLDALGWIPRTDLFVYGLGNQGGSISEHVGDVQGLDNIETVNAWRLYEAFVQYRSPADRLSVLGGVYDVNSEFAVLHTAQVFVNSSFGIGAAFALSRDEGPSIFPSTSLGARVRAVPGSKWYVQGALLDGRPGKQGDPRAHPFHFESNDGVLVVAEAGWTTPTAGPAANPEKRRRERISRFGNVDRRAHIGIGGWYYSATFDRIAPAANGATLRGNRGGYVLGEARLYAEDDPTHGALHAFLQAGYADARINRIAAYTGGGIVYTGLLPKRPADQLGLGLAVAHNGATYKRLQRRRGTPTDAGEWTAELTYAAAVTSWLMIQGDVQYIRHPDMQPSLDDALTLGLRVAVAP